MNIDIREYLRINPISTHEPTLSSDGRDCLMFFPGDDGQSGYEVHTQDMVFKEMLKSMFGSIISDDGTWNQDGTLGDGQFKNIVKKDVWDRFKADFENNLKELEEDVARELRHLSVAGAMLDYPASVEIQMERLNNLYAGFMDAVGGIWCYSDGDVQTDGRVGGRDDATIGDEPLRHSHCEVVEGEATTTPLVSNFGGGDMIGEFFSSGSGTMVSHGRRDIPHGMRLTPIFFSSTDHRDGLTYPLSGLNMMEWRNPARSHNNLPPSTNVLVRYCNWDGFASRRWVGGLACADGEGVVKFARVVDGILDSSTSAAETQYLSQSLDELEPYGEQDLTQHDCLLRMGMDQETGEILIGRQGVQTFLDIFAQICARSIGFHDDGEMRGALEGKLDGELVAKNGFLEWMKEMQDRLDGVSEQIARMRELLQTRRPPTYVGRVVMSVTDDVEAKVIANYGGRRWTRVMNFLRGVAESSESSLGHMSGEAFVCLRPSNIPIHQHGVEVVDSSVEDSSDGNLQWIQENVPGTETTMVIGRERIDGVDSSSSSVAELVETDVGIQLPEISDDVSGFRYPLPHDNMPPYREVYIWKCEEITDDEQMALDELGNMKPHSISFDPQNDKDSMVHRKVMEGAPIRVPIVQEKVGHYLAGWFLDGSTEELPIYMPGQDVTCHAKWNTRKYWVVFDASGGTCEGDDCYPPGYDGGTWQWRKQLNYDDYIPVQQIQDSIIPPEGYSVVAWDPEPPRKVPANDVLIRAVLKKNTHIVEFDANGGDGGWRKTMEYGEVIEEPIVTRTGYSFIEWQPEPEDFTVPDHDLTYVAQWRINQYKVEFDVDDPSGQCIGDDCTPIPGSTIVKTISLDYGTIFLPYAPNVSMEGYESIGWSYDRKQEGQTQVPIDGQSTVPAYDIHCYTIWEKIWYDVTLVGEWEGSTIHKKYYHYQHGAIVESVDSFDITSWQVPPKWELKGWYTEPNGGGERLEFPLVVVEGGTYYANFVVATCHVAFYPDFEGGGAAQIRTCRYGESISEPPNEISRTGYIFKGWIKNKGTQYASQWTPSTMITDRDVTYKASWQPISYTITYSANEFNWSGTVPNKTLFYDVDGETLHPLDENIRQNCHYILTVDANGGQFAPNVTTQQRGSTMLELDGWATTPDGEPICSEERGWDVKNLADVDGATVALYAKWKPVQMGVGDLDAPTKDGYIFDGWYTQAEGGSKVAGSVQLHGNTTLYAQWILNLVTVTYDPNRGTIVPETDQRRIYPAGYVITFPTVNRTGYDLVGWFDEGGTEYIKYETKVPRQGALNLHARWQAKTCTVTFDANGGTCSETTRVVTYDQPYGQMPPPTLEGKVFGYWRDADWHLVTSETIVNKTTNHTLYAFWRDD